MAVNQESKKRSAIGILLIAILAIGLVAGGFIGYIVASNSNADKTTTLQNQISSLQNQLQSLQENMSQLETKLVTTSANTSTYDTTLQDLSAAIGQAQSQLTNLQQQVNNQPSPSNLDQNVTTLQSEINTLQSTMSSLQATFSSIQDQVVKLQASSTPAPTITYQNTTYIVGDGVSLNQLFEQVKTSVVVVQGLLRQTDMFGRAYYSQIQGSGFVYKFNGSNFILTNNHVISGVINITATFTDGTVFRMTVLGSDAGTDFAVLNATTSISKYTPLQIISSSTVKVGDPVVVVGTPYGLAGSMSNGIISALNRTLATSTNTEIQGLIQTTAPLNPGNSGGPVMNYAGQVVGIATAIVQDSQGIGFAIPTDSILAELQLIFQK